MHTQQQMKPKKKNNFLEISARAWFKMIYKVRDPHQSFDTYKKKIWKLCAQVHASVFPASFVRRAFLVTWGFWVNGEP